MSKVEKKEWTLVANKDEARYFGSGGIGYNPKVKDGFLIKGDEEKKLINSEYCDHMEEMNRDILWYFNQTYCQCSPEAEKDSDMRKCLRCQVAEKWGIE